MQERWNKVFAVAEASASIEDVRVTTDATFSSTEEIQNNIQDSRQPMRDITDTSESLAIVAQKLQKFSD